MHLCLAGLIAFCALLNYVSGQVGPREDIEKEITKLDFSLCYDFLIERGKPDILLRVNLPKTMPDKAEQHE